MDQMAIVGITLMVVSVPGLLVGLALMTGKWAPAFRSADAERSRKLIGLAMVSLDAALLAVGFVLALTRL